MEWLWSLVDVRDFANTLIGAMGAIVLQWIARLYRELKGPYTGRWETRIFDEAGNVTKVDHLNIRQRGKFVRISIRRVYPLDQRHRSYLARGRIDGHDFYAIFWPKDDSIVSFGSWLVHQTNDRLFEGFYLRLDELVEKRVAQFRLEISRDRMWNRNGTLKHFNTDSQSSSPTRHLSPTN